MSAAEQPVRNLRVAIVAAEPSGDLLGAGLLRVLSERRPGLEVEGIGGPQMIAAGCRSLYPMEQLSVMGLVEVLGRIRELQRLRRDLVRRWRARPPDVFIGVDAPDFNIGLECALRPAGIPTVHYVSPSVWAWRRYRVHKIARATDLMLTLFPFEAEFYRERRLPVCFVGHPLADLIPEHSDPAAARAALGLEGAGELVALLPGSRVAEVEQLAGSFLGAARWLLAQRPGLQFVTPVVNARVRQAFERALARDGAGLPVTLIEGRGREVMAAADVVLLAAGTATLEALLLKRPMVVAYRLSTLTYLLARWLVRIPFFSLPNLLAGRALVPEFLQAAVTPENLGRALLAQLERPELRAEQMAEYQRIHALLRRGASVQAAETVLALVAAGAAPRGTGTRCARG